MPLTINVNNLSLCHKGSGGVSKATLPDFCFTPISPSTPVPLRNAAYSKDLVKGTNSISADGGNMCANFGSEFFKSTGDENGSLGGVTSGTHLKEATWITHSFDVKYEGKGACRLTDKMFHNHVNTVNTAGLEQDALALGKAKKADCYKCRKALVADGKNSDDPNVRKAANRLGQQQQDYEHALLSSDVYDKGEPPTGWNNISDNREALEKYNLTPEDLANSRGQMYEPDPSVFGNDMNPTVAFEGTDPASLRDWINNGRQGVGWSSEYYDNAMEVGQQLSGTGVDVTGHSLGGGLASAAAQTGGLDGTTFNSAGLHGQTVPNPVPGVNIDAYRVDGEILTELQEGSLTGLQNERYLRNGLIIDSRYGFYTNSLGEALNRAWGGVKQLARNAYETVDAAIGTLMPDAIGNKFNLPGTGNPLARHDMSQVISGMEQQMAEDQAILEKALGRTCNC